MRQIFGSKIITVILIIIVGALTISLSRLVIKTIVQRRALLHLEEQIAILQRQKAEFAQKKSYFQSDSYLEQQARLKLNYKKPNENVVFIYNQTPTPTPSASATPATATSSSFATLFNRLLDFFKNK